MATLLHWITGIVLCWQAVRGESVDCDFEVKVKTCNWTPDQSTWGSQWVKGSGDLPDSDTGPPGDHTLLPSGSGHYLYTRSSERQYWWTARIFSPPIGKNPDFPVCFSFWYYMYGSTVGTLNVYVKQNYSDPLGTPLGTPAWTRTGNQAQDWLQLKMTLDYPATVTVFIESIVISRGYHGIIAIDDIRLYPGPCSNTASLPSTVPTGLPGSTAAVAMTTPASPATIDCNFDESVCGWKRNQFASFIWYRNSGATITDKTGPTADHTTGHGFYMYIEASWPRVPNQFAVLQSPMLYPSNDEYSCLSFWYHMSGDDVNQLYASIHRPNGHSPRIWQKDGSQGNTWLFANATVSPPGPLQVAFIGSVGDGDEGDIAIDDVKLTSGKCRHTVPSVIG